MKNYILTRKVIFLLEITLASCDRVIQKRMQKEL